MSVSVVNGYLCYSCCDVAKAKRGEDPHPKHGADAISGHNTAHGGRQDASLFDGPAVTFGGILRAAASANSTDLGSPATAAQDTTAAADSAASIDLLV
jgi:hypothetical protein